MISVDEAKKIIAAASSVEKSISVSLADSFGFTLAEDIFASIDIPAFAQSSMDGYAFRFSDKNMPLQIIGEMAAGKSDRIRVGNGEVTRIFTGAPLPDGADTVVMQEKVKVSGNKLFLQDPQITLGSNVRNKGAEVQKDSLAMAKGTYLSAAAIGFLAGIGCTEVEIFSSPSVTIILTGNELQEPGKPLEFGQVYEANSFLLSAALKKAGISQIKIHKAEDNLETLSQVLKEALLESDIILLNGGVSVGDYDFTVAAAEANGIQRQFHKIKQKPGKPLFFGTKGNQLIFGLPGNPSSGLTCFYEYVLPAIEIGMNKQSSVVVTKAFATHDYSKPAGLSHFLKAFHNDGKVTPLHAQESFRLHSFAQANCFIVLNEDSIGCNSGDLVEVHLLPL